MRFAVMTWWDTFRPPTELPARLLSAFPNQKQQEDQTWDTPKRHDRCSDTDAVLGPDGHLGPMWSAMVIIAGDSQTAFSTSVLITVSLFHLFSMSEAYRVHFSGLLPSIKHSKCESMVKLFSLKEELFTLVYLKTDLLLSHQVDAN